MRIDLSVENMTCGGCVRSITKAVQSLDPGARVAADIGNKLVSIDSTASEQALLQAIGTAGFPARRMGGKSRAEPV